MTTPVPPFADPSDVVAIWRALSDDEYLRAAVLLDEASQVILEIAPVAARVTAGLVADATLRSVCSRMVLRVMLNPQRLSQFSVTVEDVTKSGTYESGMVPAGELTVTPNELDRLMGRVGAATAFTVMHPDLLVAPVDDNGFPPTADFLKLYLLDPTD
jgi:hypothetical protein